MRAARSSFGTFSPFSMWQRCEGAARTRSARAASVSPRVERRAAMRSPMGSRALGPRIVAPSRVALILGAENLVARTTRVRELLDGSQGYQVHCCSPYGELRGREAAKIGHSRALQRSPALLTHQYFNG